MSVEEEIARARRDTELANDIAGIVFDEIKRVWPDLHPLFDLRYGIADRVIALPLLNRVRAEGFKAGWCSSGEGFNGEYPDEGVPWAQSAGREAYARWLEQNSEGNET